MTIRARVLSLLAIIFATFWTMNFLHERWGVRFNQIEGIAYTIALDGKDPKKLSPGENEAIWLDADTQLAVVKMFVLLAFW